MARTKSTATENATPGRYGAAEKVADGGKPFAEAAKLETPIRQNLKRLRP
jgi:hypothetical protein